ncbi:MAG: F0F1 ATP synthase subunit A [Acidobacteriota bacterium]|nr:F0F1 ATP synthase subunit A [Acidobacteriota bacterium]
MEALEHPSPLVQLVNALLAPLHLHAPDHLVFSALICLIVFALGMAIRANLSVENPGKLQILLEDVVGFFVSSIESFMGPKGRQFLPLLGGLFVFIWIGNMMGQIPGLGAPTSNINVPFACAITLWLYYHFQGVRAQGPLAYIKHFAVMPGVPIVMAPMIFVIEIISHLSRVLSLTLRLFGNIFGEHLVVLIIGSIVPFLMPLPIQFLGLVVGTLQAFIFLVLGAIYLGAAVAVDEHH